jgi:hypothetical protein
MKQREHPEEKIQGYSFSCEFTEQHPFHIIPGEPSAKSRILKLSFCCRLLNLTLSDFFCSLSILKEEAL